MVREDTLHEPGDEDRVRGPSDLRPAAFGLLAVLTLLGMCVPTLASAQDIRCSDYKSLDRAQRAYLAYGYLEGVQGALDKEGTDILVPPSDPRHPIWWVLPSGLPDKPFIGLAEKVDAYCRVPGNQRETLLRAFLSQSVHNEGRPWLGASTFKKESASWKNFLGGKETSLSCPDYLANPELTRQANYIRILPRHGGAPGSPGAIRKYPHSVATVSVGSTGREAGRGSALSAGQGRHRAGHALAVHHRAVRPEALGHRSSVAAGPPLLLGRAPGRRLASFPRGPPSALSAVPARPSGPTKPFSCRAMRSGDEPGAGDGRSGDRTSGT